MTGFGSDVLRLPALDAAVAASSAPALTGADPTYWPCEYCRAEHGQPCRSRQSRRPLVAVHVNRHRAVTLFQRYGKAAGL